MTNRLRQNSVRLGILALAMTVTVVVAAPRSQCWMTGGGSIFATEYGGGQRFTHGFQLDCVPRRNDTLQVNDHGTGWNFHLREVTAAICIDDPGLEPNPPEATFDTYVGQGTGICRNVGGESRSCWATWTFTDGGEIGGCLRDTAVIEVRDDDNNLLIGVSGDVNCGNHQAHSR